MSPTPTTSEFVAPDIAILARRESAYPTGSNGCVICPQTTPTCPKCAKDEECTMRTATCQQCPVYVCLAKEKNGSSGVPIGGIVGGAIGGIVVLLLVAGVFYYHFVYRKKHPRLDDEDMALSDYEYDNSLEDDDVSSGNDKRDSSISSPLDPQVGAALEKPPQRRTNSGNNVANRRLSSYESFTRPKTRYNRRPKRVANSVAGARTRVGQERAQGPYIDPRSLNRNSVATTISTTNASNILPIAYIPGVTVRPTKNNTRSIYSYETDSIFSDLDTLENASIIGDVMKANNPGLELRGKNATMTAIKAQPRLVNVDRIEEEDEDEDVSDEEPHLSSQRASKLNASSLTNLGQTAQEYESDDSDVDLDIGEITRATSVKRKQASLVRSSIGQDREILLDIPAPQHRNANDVALDLIGAPPQAGDGASVTQSTDSFILDIAMDDGKETGERSPFDDPEIEYK